MVGRAHSQYAQSNPIPTRCATHKLVNNYITEVLSQKWEFWASHQAAQPGGLALSEGLLRALGFGKASRAWSQKLHRTVQNRNSTLLSWRVHTRFYVHWDPGKKQWLHRSLRQKFLLVLWRLQGRQGVAVATVETKTLEAEVWGCTLRCEPSWRLPFWPGPTQQLQCRDASGQTTNRAGTQPHPSAERLPKVFLTPQPTLNTALDVVLPTRGVRPSSTH